MKKIVIPFLGLCVLLSACNKQAAERIDVLSDEVQFSLGGPAFEAEVMTRASVVNKSSLETSGIKVAAATGTAGTSDTEVWNADFAKGSDGIFRGGKYWPNSNPSYHFYASNVAMTRESTGKGYTVAASNATDIVCAYLASPSYKTTNMLSFEHIFARLGSVTVSAAAGYTISNISITVTPKTGGTYNLFTGAGKTDGTGWSSTSNGTAAGIANATPGTKNNDIYLVPGSYVLTATWTATRGNYTQTFSSKTKTVSLVGGKVNKITTTLGGSASEIEFSIEVADWGENNINVDFGV